MKIIFFGDICYKSGLNIVTENAKKLKEKYEADFLICNGENAANGKGLNCAIANQLFTNGIDCITLGNHYFSKKEIFNCIDSSNKIIRPYNYSKLCPGKGYTIINKNNKKLAIINMAGQVGMTPCNNPFEAMDSIIDDIRKETKCVIVDFHGEATSEKLAFAWDFDGRLSAFIGTHTHVQTADNRLLDFGTGYITDAGMCGPYDGIIGCKREIVTERFRTGMSEFFKAESGKTQLCGVFIEIDEDTGKCIKMERIYEIKD